MEFSYSLWVAIIANVVAQSFKPVYEKWKNGEWDWSLLFTTGKFPSSHTATVTALALRIGVDWGFNSVGFAISFLFGSIVIADASGVRQEVGKHAKYINNQMKKYITFIGLILIGLLLGWLLFSNSTQTEKEHNHTELVV